MHAGHALLDRARDVEVRGAGQVRVDAALHAHLGGADLPGLLGAVGDLVERERVRVGVGAPLREGAEAAAGVADVGEVDVPGDHVGDVVADGLAAQRRRRSGTVRPAPGPSACNSASACASVSLVGSSAADGRSGLAHVAVDALRDAAGRGLARAAPSQSP